MDPGPQRGGLQELTRVAGQRAAEELAFTLRSVDIDARTLPAPQPGGVRGELWIVAVPADRLARAREILAEEGPAADIIPLPRPRRRPGLYWVVGLVVLQLLVFIAMEGQGGSEQIATLERFGAAQAPLVLGGQWWRLVCAIFLHIGARHLLGNLFTLALFGPAALGRWGAARFYLIYLTAGLAGNLASLALSPTAAFKAGASGAILGLLGALAGARIRDARQPGAASRFKTWHILAMILAYYGFGVGVGPADHLAHLGGLLAGGLLGLLLPGAGALPPRTERALDLGSGLLVAALAGAAGLLQVLGG